MTFFISIILSIGIELSVKSLQNWRRFDWFSQLTDWVCHRTESTRFRDGPVVVLAILTPVLFAVWLVAAMLGGVWGAFEFVFGVAVLSMSLGPSDPIRQTQDYIKSLQDEDTAEAKSHAAKILTMDVSDVDDDVAITAQQVKEALLIKGCSSILGVFFWFIVLGPVGAAMFRLSCLLQGRYAGTQTGFARAIMDFYQILMWVPARFTVLCYAVVGSFVDALHSLRHLSDLWQRDSDELLIETGLGALHILDVTAEEERQGTISAVVECLSLTKRAVLACITFLAVIVIVSWIV